ncbi:MAG TPA: VWA domain-containing protein [Pyrinomonadaceae bacterium]|nr:VWA domain-containing protein [Pyrinomonadaceae bacterium]
MKSSVIRRAALSLIVVVCVQVGAAQSRPARQDDDEVIRVNAEIVQTDVTVLDKRGRFAEDLKPEQFELKVDGRAVPLAFFERVRAGGADEESKLAAARGVKTTAGAHTREPIRQTVEGRGRVIFFFVDDLHLGGDSLSRARKSLLKFIDEQMASGDIIAVASTSGRVGFLQQLTDNKTVLRAAVERLAYIRNTEPYAGKVPISEADANRIVNHRDRELFAYLIEATKNEYQMGGLGIVNMVRNRLRQINAQGMQAEQATFAGLGGLLESSAPLAGRKLVFFISDGFVSDYKRSNGPDVLRIVTEEAARVGAVVYTLDARGTFGDPAVDASRNDYPDFAVRTNGRSFFDAKMTQEPLERLAAETGGRAFLNNNSFNDAFRQAVDESSNYYLIAWRPDTDAQRAGDSRVDVSVKGRPDLRVQLRRRYFSARPSSGLKEKTRKTSAVEDTSPTATPSSTSTPTATPSSSSSEAPSSSPSTSSTSSTPSSSTSTPASARQTSVESPEKALRAALASLYPLKGLPLALSVGYLDAQGRGTVLAASMQLDSEALDFGEGEGADSSGGAQVDVWGVAIDDRGSFASFKQTLGLRRDALARAGLRFAQWGQQLQLPPGLYQVRVAARDRRTGRTGSASQWVEIPQPTTPALSSIFLAETRRGSGVAPVNVSRRFKRDSRLRFQTFVYNAQGSTPSDVTLRVEVLRDGTPVLTLPEANPSRAASSDPARLPFSGELSLAELPPGRYVIQISAAAQSKLAVRQQANFILE